MMFWSEGLGESSLDMPMGDATMVREGDHVLITGKTGAPVFWEFKMTMREEDFRDMFMIARSPNMAGFLVNSERRWSAYFKIVRAALGFAWKIAVSLLKKRRCRKPVEAKTGEVIGEAERFKKSMSGGEK